MTNSVMPFMMQLNIVEGLQLINRRVRTSYKKGDKGIRTTVEH